MKKICLIVGARPNFMKAFPVYESLKEDFELILIHTGQHYDEKMSDVFFNQLKFPRPDIHLSLEKKTKSGDFDDKLYVNNVDYLKDKDAVIQELMKYDGDLGQLGEIRDKLKVEFEKGEPDLVIVFGDVTSTLAAGLAAKTLNIDLAHVESGLRSGDMLMPEEVNRVLTDHISKYYFVTEQSGVDNLQNEGKTENVYLVGNTMIDTQKKYLQQALDTKYNDHLGLSEKEYVLVTLHRPSNVDDLDKLREIFDDLIELSKKEKLVYPIHPRTKGNLEKLGYLKKVQGNENIRLEEPLGYLEFTCLMANCKYLITDSGGLQEESTALDIPCFTLRENTERPSTLIENNGTNQLINKISEIELKEYKGSMELWDGNSSEKILLLIYNYYKKIFLYKINKSYYRNLHFAWNKFETIDYLNSNIKNFKHSIIKKINNFNDIPKELNKFVIKNNFGCSGKSVYVIEKINNNLYKDILHNKILPKNNIEKIIENNNNFFIERIISNNSKIIPYDCKIHILDNKILFSFLYDRNNNNITKCIIDKNCNIINCNDFYYYIKNKKYNGIKENINIINNLDSNLYKNMIQMAYKIYNLLNLRYCSIDFLFYKNDYSFCELTPTPGSLNYNLNKKYVLPFINF